MRVDWVHPSWRDLVIESLVSDAQTRRRWLARCGVDGAALALAYDGLLAEDADWDALGDALYRLCPNLGEADAIRLLQVLEGESGEALALARLVLERLDWAGKTLSVDALCAWAPVAARMEPGVEPPAVGRTWAALEPADVPREPAELERFADWLRLAELLREYDPGRLERFGFPERHLGLLLDFVRQRVDDEPPLERDLRLEALGRVAILAPPLTRRAIRRAEVIAEPAPSRAMAFEALSEPPAPDGFPVERVLRDLR